MNRRIHALLALYLAGVLFAAHCATNSARNGDPWYSLGLVAVSLLLVAALVREYGHADEQHHAAVRAELAARPPDMNARAIRDDIALGWADLHAACCLRAWETRGAAHDTALCARKDTAA